MTRYALCISKQLILKKERGKRKDSSYEKLTGYIIDNELHIEPSTDGYIYLDENIFDLHSILGDILATTNIESIIVKCFGIDIPIDDKEKYSAIYNYLKKLIVQNQPLSLQEFDIICSYFQASIKYSVSSDSNKSIYENIVLMDTFSYKFNNLNSFFPNKNTSKTLYIYSCDDIIDIILSIIHFLSRYDYRFYRCPICNRYSFYLKQKGRVPIYCNRKGIHNLSFLLKNANNYTCGEAVNAILDNVKKNRRSIYRNLEANHSDILNDFFNDFENSYNKFKSTHNKNDLIELANKVNSEAKKYWYKTKEKDQ